MSQKHIGAKVIIRGDRSGVFFGTLTEQDGREVELKDARRLWYWDGANSISDIAIKGVKKPKNCRFTSPVGKISILDAVEIIPCTGDAIKNINEVAVWTY